MSRHQQHEDYRQRSALLTLLVAAALSSLLLLTIFSDTIPPQGEPPFAVVGRIDFGNFTEGSKDKNDFTDPAPEEKVEPKPEQKQQKPKRTAPEEAITTTAPAKTSIQAATKQSKKPQPQPVEEEEEEDEPEEPGMTFDEDRSSTKSGSNHGESQSLVGNAGNPDSKSLDPSGNIFFGDGTAGRRIVYREAIPYSSNDEGMVKFMLTVNPDGRVIKVEKLNHGVNATLVKDAVSALMKYRFSKSDETDQFPVTINFRLK